MANRNWSSGGKIYSMHVSPVQIDCKFMVDEANENGLGISNLKGPTVASVTMHSTAATPSSMNPAEGTIVVRLMDGYNKSLISIKGMIQSPLSGSDVKIDNSAMTAGVAYVITTLGDASEEKWHEIGVPAGVTPAVGVSFIAASNGGAGDTLTSRVQATATLGSEVASIEMVGDPTLSVSPDASANQGFGAQFILQCRDYAGAIIQPADDSIISLAFLLNNSSITVQGE